MKHRSSSKKNRSADIYNINDTTQEYTATDIKILDIPGSYGIPEDESNDTTVTDPQQNTYDKNIIINSELGGSTSSVPAIIFDLRNDDDGKYHKSNKSTSCATSPSLSNKRSNVCSIN